ncbi:dihydroorotate dehydrogenase electron transfer subunit [Tepidanaerobacter syntrophicus]|uniref:Dihydroorotate dehydrogenase B (NAD(+)), electron transfer subunit n=1 Tax=Tepidanaerobacter syntrophicus TaxID=224999 RepID=A0A0U9HFV1_9FIRM|nr:dihydroorotate dehydrogenase electron transfer subunit [Tepidanaerobacter syntrophicus]GAQ25712.1 dihydroorotate dehydrogenase electron transfer subunit [Tepidanaerobacter syntrophicus]GLI20075.1 dihydroorotate dehydrogenase B (NAD(+)), electron transfer subunit [Tepidanaerobacter syntrophicus]
MRKPVVLMAPIVQNTEIAPGIYNMKLEAPDIAKTAEPGQFLHIRCSQALAPLLRRPISIADADEKNGRIDIIYRVVGEGTKLLSEKLPGEKADIIGPLGNGFYMPPKDSYPIIIAGGIGTAPILYLAKKIALKSNSSASVILGFTTESEIFGTDYLKCPGINLSITTDDGSFGYKGFPTDILENLLKSWKNAAPPIIYACGPKPLLVKIKEITQRENILAYLSLEQRMACGVGACLGCSVKSSFGGYKKVCKDGPVFKACEVELC